MEKVMNRLPLLLFFLLLGLPIKAQTDKRHLSSESLAGCLMVKIETERLPDLNIPRSGHSFFIVNGQPTVIGGHTFGFVLTPTAEYFADGQWHVVPIVYSHDAGGSILLRSGKILLFGSHEKNLGIGQTFEVEMYNPADHSSKGFGCLDRKRVMPSAVETDGGKVVIAGNWYNDDGIELYEGESQFSEVKPVAIGRARPYMLPVSNGDVLIFGDIDIHGEVITSILVDRLLGDAFCVPLFEQWKPFPTDAVSPRSEDCFIGDLQKKDMVYLVPVADRNTGQAAIAQVRDTVFSLLPTEVPIPMETGWGAIFYRTPIVTDQQAKRAYMAGLDMGMHLCILSIEYDKSPCPLTLYYTDPLPHLGLNHLRLTPAGNLLIAGGANGIDNDNFSPSNQVWLVPLTSNQDFHNAATASWLWWLAALVLVLAVVVATLLWRHRRSKQPEAEEPSSANEKVDEQLWQRICQLMDEQQFFLNKNLKLADVAAALDTNSRYVSATIKQYRDCTFSDFIAAYRVGYAQQLLSAQPDKKMSAVAIESGFSGESSFFRAFKSVTGLTPTEWRNR